MLSVRNCVTNETRSDRFPSLLHRLPVEAGQKPPINEIQFFLHPLELLADVKKLLQVGNVRNEQLTLYLLIVDRFHHQNQPMSASFEKIAQAVSLFDTWHDFHRGFVTDSEQWAQHAVQSSVWASAGMLNVPFLTAPNLDGGIGCAKLADIEESVVLAFTDPGSNDNSRLTATVNRAYRVTRPPPCHTRVN